MGLGGKTFGQTDCSSSNMVPPGCSSATYTPDMTKLAVRQLESHVAVSMVMQQYRQQPSHHGMNHAGSSSQAESLPINQKLASKHRSQSWWWHICSIWHIFADSSKLHLRCSTTFERAVVQADYSCDKRYKMAPISAHSVKAHHAVM